MTQAQDAIGSTATMPLTRRFIKRIVPRHEVRMRARLRERGRGAIDVTVYDLSRYGFQSDVLYPLEPGTLVWIRVPGFESFAAHVCWCGANRVGCAFETPLHPAICTWLVERYAIDEWTQKRDMLRCGTAATDLSHA